MTEIIDSRRRRLLMGSAGAVAAVGLAGVNPRAFAAEEKPFPNYVAWKERDALIFHSAQTFETQRGAVGVSVITPTKELFVRNNLPAPDESIIADRDAWELAVQGTKNARTLTVAELKTLGVETVASVLQCSGNGRAFFDHKASGTPWTVGAAGCVLWTGVPVRRVIEALGGLDKSAKFMTGTGGESLPQGLDPKSLMVERSVPLAALENALLAWEINGEPLPLAHGGPLRLVVPGYYGVNNIKYIRQLAFTEQETDAKIQTSGYRVRPVGEKGAPDQLSMWEMNVKSWVTSPLQQAKTGRTLIQGVAFGGAQAVKGVEVSVDGGKSWQKARFVGPDLGQFAWRPFVLEAELKPGTYLVASRATDSKGNAQPENFPENERGYAHNGWRRHAVEITVA
jgi:DMSO/TMAO reductase YedYZ molybdopterin-dependent catalytic subunit